LERSKRREWHARRFDGSRRREEKESVPCSFSIYTEHTQRSLARQYEIQQLLGRDKHDVREKRREREEREEKGGGREGGGAMSLHFFGRSSDRHPSSSFLHPSSGISGWEREETTEPTHLRTLTWEKEPNENERKGRRKGEGESWFEESASSAPFSLLPLSPSLPACARFASDIYLLRDGLSRMVSLFLRSNEGPVLETWNL